MALFPQGEKSVSRSHASTDASSSVPPPLPRWRLRLAHTSLPVQDYNGNPSCLLAPKFLTHWSFPASPPCLVVTSGLATRITWTQSLLRLLAAVLWWCLLKSLPTSLSVWFLLLPFTFNVIAALLHSKWLPTPGICTTGLGMEDAPDPMLVNVISVPWRAVPGVVARKRFIVASPCLWLWGSVQNPTGGREDKNSTQKLCSEIPSPRSAGAKLSILPFKDQIASGPGWLS